MRPQVEEMKEAVQNTSLETIKAAKLNVRVADETERKAMARRDGAEGARGATRTRRRGGQKVLAAYDEERKKLGF